MSDSVQSFKNQGYCVIKDAISPDVCNVAANYFSFLDTYHRDLVTWEPKYGSAGRYNDPLGESLLFQIHPVVEKHTGMQLIPTYSHMRLYKKGAHLRKHTDRPACEIGVTIPLGADSPSSNWPIHIESNGQEKEIKLEVGDILIYRGCDVPHWRESFEGAASAHVFLFFVDANGKHTNQAFDGRKGLGAPQPQKKPAALKDEQLQKKLIDKAIDAREDLDR